MSLQLLTRCPFCLFCLRIRVAPLGIIVSPPIPRGVPSETEDRLLRVLFVKRLHKCCALCILQLMMRFPFSIVARVTAVRHVHTLVIFRNIHVGLYMDTVIFVIVIL